MLFELPGGRKINTDMIESFEKTESTVVVRMVSGAEFYLDQLVGITLMGIVKNASFADNQVAY